VVLEYSRSDTPRSEQADSTSLTNEVTSVYYTWRLEQDLI